MSATTAEGAWLARVPRAPLVVLVVGSFLASVALPLATYTLSLATFGIAHVLTELRYVDHRFGRRTPRQVLVVVSALLAAVVVARVLAVTGLVAGATVQPIELLLVIALAAVPLPYLRERGTGALLVGLVTACALVTALALDPLLGLLVLAVLHNATPVGFLVEAAPPSRRITTLVGATVLFLGVPLVIASGLPALAFDALGVRARDLGVLDTGVLADHYKVYLPRMIATLPSAEHLFSGIVFAQCMHYAVVIHVLPRLLPDDGPRPLVPWPSPRVFLVGLIAVGGAFFLGFTATFGMARSVYGIFAAVHAWIEVPVLLLALVGAGGAAALSETPRAG